MLSLLFDVAKERSQYVPDEEEEEVCKGCVRERERERERESVREKERRD